MSQVHFPPYRPPYDAQVFKELHAMSESGIIAGELMRVHNSAKEIIDDAERSGMKVSDCAEMLLELNLLEYA